MDEQTRVAAVYNDYDTRESAHRKWSRENPGNRYLEALRDAAFSRLLAEERLAPLDDKCILDVGCGTGDFIAGLCERSADPGHCHGIDILPERIERARVRVPDATFHVGDAQTLPFEDSSFEVVAVNMVFGSILSDTVAHAVAREIRRVVAPGGAVIWLEHRYPNPWNAHVRHYTPRDLRRLFPGFAVRGLRIAPIPPLVRRLGRATPLVAPLLAAVPALRVDYLAVVRAPH